MSEYDLDDVPLHPAAWMREMVLQLERTERATLEQQQANQANHLRELVRHSLETVPAYKDRLKPLIRANGEISLDGWLDVPVLKRKDAVDFGDDLVSTCVPASHGKINQNETSGSTGVPLKFNVTQFHRTMWSCITARYHRWNKINYHGSLATIRSYPLGEATWPQGIHRDYWAPSALKPDSPGTFHRLNVNTPVEQQCEWLRKIKPDYFHSFTNNARAVALAMEEQGDPLKFQGVLTYAEMSPPETREIISRVFGCHVGDCYSTNECGYLALQSPVSGNWLVQSEVTLLEILNDQNLPCEQGEMGRVVVTALHNYAQPLIRYELGDYATWGPPDASGFPFPVVSKIHGRTRNLFRLPGGILIQPDFKPKNVHRYLSPKKWQVAQTGETTLEFRIIPGIEPAQMNTEGMNKYICELLGMDLTINYKLLTEMPNPRTGKCEDYVCELPEK